MKLALLAFFFLLLNSSTAEVVLDNEGEPLLPSRDYYMVSFISPGPGGVSLANSGNNKTCPVDVIAVPCCRNCIPPTENCNGEALKFNPLAKIGIVPTNHPLTISFAKTPSCAQSPEWILVKEEGAWLVGIGGPEDHPDTEILTGLFIIERYFAGYTLKFCPKHLPEICGSLGLHSDANQNTRLALTNDIPYMVHFRRAGGRSSAI
ncbi:hypothetical protein QN277_005907 [Acacia crassicarpa]|uniref:Uncharacterized protein n=1 Tax=Acacia crassicarpa TaxID=499986 RepID=A0AAE1IYY7_9FABA|nr:hypothetical protein QN277_005907 [Acacia crassicarpa]